MFTFSLQVLSDFRSARFPLDYLVELIPRLQPRQFSISSSPLVCVRVDFCSLSCIGITQFGQAHPGRIHITLAVLEFITPYQRHKTGVCSQFLRSRRPMLGQCLYSPSISVSHCVWRVVDKVPVWCRRGSVRLRSHSLQPLLLVGTGTGIALFRSMIHELDAIRSSTSIAHAEQTEIKTRTGSWHKELLSLILALTTTSATLFFGCRAREQDFLYADEWPSFVSSGTIERLETAFSRDQPYKIYVQDRIRECGEHVWHLLNERDAIFCLSGSVPSPNSCVTLSCGLMILCLRSAKQMPADVRAALLDVIRERGGLNAKQSEAFLKELQKKARYFVECWA